MIKPPSMAAFAMRPCCWAATGYPTKDTYQVHHSPGIFGNCLTLGFLHASDSLGTFSSCIRPLQIMNKKKSRDCPWNSGMVLVGCMFKGVIPLNYLPWEVEGGRWWVCPKYSFSKSLPELLNYGKLFGQKSPLPLSLLSSGAFSLSPSSYLCCLADLSLPSPGTWLEESAQSRATSPHAQSLAVSWQSHLGAPVDKQVFSQLRSSRLDTPLSIVVALSSPIQGFKYLRQNCSSIKLEKKASVWGQQFPSDFLPEVIQVRGLGCRWAVAWEQETSLVFRGPTLPEGTLRNCYVPNHISLCGIHSVDPHGLPSVGN